jgi:hypothetical protein
MEIRIEDPAVNRIATASWLFSATKIRVIFKKYL